MSLRQWNWEQHPTLYSPLMPPVIVLNTNQYQYHKFQRFSETVFSKKLLQKHRETQFTVTHNLLNVFFFNKSVFEVSDIYAEFQEVWLSQDDMTISCRHAPDAWVDCSTETMQSQQIVALGFSVHSALHDCRKKLPVRFFPLTRRPGWTISKWKLMLHDSYQGMSANAEPGRVNTQVFIELHLLLSCTHCHFDHNFSCLTFLFNSLRF